MIPANELVDPPKLSGDELQTFGQYIHDIIESYKSERDGRVALVQKFRAFHNDDFSARKVEGTVFAYSNISVPVCKAVAVTYAAKLYAALTGDDKLVVTAKGAEDRQPAINFQKFWTWLLDDIIKMPVIRARECDVLASEGTCVTKRLWKRQASYFKRKRMQLHTPDGQPMTYPDGKPIGENPPTMMMPPDGLLGALGIAGPTMHLDFQGIPGPQITDDHKFNSVEFQDRIVHYNNADVSIIPFESFVCDMKVDKIEKSLLVAHEFDLTLWDIMQRVEDDRLNYEQNGINVPRGTAPPGWNSENLRKLKGIAKSKSSDPAQQSKPIFERGEHERGEMPIIDSQEGSRTLNLVEGHIRYDIDNDGWPEDVVFLYEKTNRLVLWQDYLINQYADCQRPFTAHVLIPVQNRWYGMGPYEWLDGSQDFLDRCFNRINFRNAMAANPQSWVDPSVFEGPPPDAWEVGGRWTCKAGQRGDAGHGFFVMPQQEGVEQYFIDLFMSIMRLVSGVTNPAAGEISNLPSQQTLGGTQAIISEGNAHFNMLLQGPTDSMSVETAGVIQLSQQNISEAQVFRFDKGLESVMQVVRPEDIRDLKFDVKIRLEKNSIGVRADLAKAAMQIVQAYVALPPAYQRRLRALFIMALQAVGVAEAEDVLPSNEELEKDQSNDSVLQQAAVKIGEGVARMKALGMNPLNAIANDMLGVVPMLQQVMAQPPPDPVQGQGGAPDMEGNLPMRIGAPGGGAMAPEMGSPENPVPLGGQNAPAREMPMSQMQQSNPPM